MLSVPLRYTDSDYPFDIFKLVLLVTFDRSLVSSTMKTDRHDIADILLKVALNTIPLFEGYQWRLKERC